MSQISIDYRTQYEAAEACIRELENSSRNLADIVQEQTERIAKAKAILESSDGMTQKMKDALAVLEGK